MPDPRPVLSLIAGLLALAAPAFADTRPPQTSLPETPLPVTAVTVATAPSRQILTMTGTVEAQETVPVAFKAAGRIIRLIPDLGDSVTAGDIIAALEPTQAVEIQRAAAAQLAATEAAATQAEQAYLRARDLLERGAGRQAELDAAQQGWLEAAARRDEAAAGLVKAQQALEDMTVRAPVSGLVTARTAEEGQIAAAGQPVVAIATLDAREAVFAVPSFPTTVSLLDQPVDIALLDDAGQTVTARVTEVAPITDAATGTVTVRVALPAQATAFGLGAAVTARFETGAEMAISLPAAALQAQNDAPAVWVIDPVTGRVAIRPVTITRYTSTGIDIAGGLELGERVVVAGAHLLYPDRLVAPQEVQP